MFLTCQVDLPVAMTMKSAQSQCFFPGITFTLSALTSLRIFSTSWSSRSPKFLDMAGEEKEEDIVWLKLGNPSFHCWISCEEEEKEDRDRRPVHMGSRLSVLFYWFTLLPSTVAPLRLLPEIPPKAALLFGFGRWAWFVLRISNHFKCMFG